MQEPKTYGLTLDEFIKTALDEDTGNGDHTSISTIDENKSGKARVKIKENGVISGLEIAQSILHFIDKSIKVQVLVKEGALVSEGEIAMKIEGNVRNMLKAERLLLNCMQRMSGIATLTRKFVDAIEGTESKILDTRKTTPNFRYFEKSAVRAGGGHNHRFGLYDMILIKDNHVDSSGGITAALKRVSDYLNQTGLKLQVEIETRNLSEVNEVINIGIANRILLDNMQPQEISEAVKLINNRFQTEASGGINLSNVRSYAFTGVNFISVGALTHSYKSLDISMKVSL